jgi:hypothetical protein
MNLFYIIYLASYVIAVLISLVILYKKYIYIMMSLTFLFILLCIHLDGEGKPIEVNRHKLRYQNHLGIETFQNETDFGFEIIDTYNHDSTSNVFSTSLYGNNPKYYKHLDSIISSIEKI